MSDRIIAAAELMSRTAMQIRQFEERMQAEPMSQEDITRRRIEGRYLHENRHRWDEIFGQVHR